MNWFRKSAEQLLAHGVGHVMDVPALHFFNCGRAYSVKGELDRAIADYSEAIGLIWKMRIILPNAAMHIVLKTMRARGRTTQRRSGSFGIERIISSLAAMPTPPNPSTSVQSWIMTRRYGSIRS
jgi:hypothetical protein